MLRRDVFHPETIESFEVLLGTLHPSPLAQHEALRLPREALRGLPCECFLPRALDQSTLDDEDQ
ncbi:hypothetical protein D3C80_2111370 [compost metagenome]